MKDEPKYLDAEAFTEWVWDHIDGDADGKALLAKTIRERDAERERWAMLKPQKVAR